MDDLDPIGNSILLRVFVYDRYQALLDLNCNNAFGSELRREDRPNAGAGPHVEEIRFRIHTLSNCLVKQLVPQTIGKHQSMVIQHTRNKCCKMIVSFLLGRFSCRCFTWPGCRFFSHLLILPAPTKPRKWKGQMKLF